MEKEEESKFWRYFVNIWSLVVFATIIGDFVYNNGVKEILGPVLVIYTAGLAIYSTEKEFLRWHDEWGGRHPGEIYVFFWTILIVVILLSDLLFSKPYALPSEVLSAYIAVLGVLAITKQSKRLYKEKCKKESVG